MIIINNVQYRNLEEQVKKNMDDIQYILEQEGILNEFGIKVVGEITSFSELPDPDTYEGVYGDAYAVGTASPYTLYIYTRANGSHPNNYWFNIGEFPLAGPTGSAGPQGPTGPQGQRGSTWSSGTNTPTTTSGSLTDDKYLNTTNGDVYNYTGSTWQLIGNIRGPQGIQGPQGPMGPAGSGSNTNGFYKYNSSINNPIVGGNYTYNDSLTAYPVGLEFVSGQMVIDNNGNIYSVGSLSIMTCIYTSNKTNGFYKYNSTFNAPVVGKNYSYSDTSTDYPEGFEFVPGQMVIDGRGNIYNVGSKSIMTCVYRQYKYNSFIKYNAIVDDFPTVGQSYTYDNDYAVYPSGVSYIQNQLIIDNNGAIYQVTSTSMCVCQSVGNLKRHHITIDINGSSTANYSELKFTFDLMLPKTDAVNSDFLAQYFSNNNCPASWFAAYGNATDRGGTSYLITGIGFENVHYNADYQLRFNLQANGTIYSEDYFTFQNTWEITDKIGA